MKVDTFISTERTNYTKYNLEYEVPLEAAIA